MPPHYEGRKLILFYLPQITVSKARQYLYCCYFVLPMAPVSIAVAVRSKAWVYGRLLIGIVGLNPA
jgi:hypothetical protein